MKITNKNGIPAPIFRSISKNWYGGAGEKKQFCSVTQLLKSAKIFVLEKRYARELQEEASDLIWALMGSAMHKVLEKSESKNSLNEERLSCEISGKIISGGIDLYENSVISDFKFTSVWTYIYGSRLQEWTEQLNIYSYLYAKANFPVERLQVIAIFRDWSKLKSRIESDYPQQVMIVPIKLWKMSRTEKFIKEKLSQLETALKLPDDKIAPCTLAQRWQDPEKFAVMKKGNKRALKLFESRELASRFISFHKDREKLNIEIRESLPRRCQDYCLVNGYCNFFQNYKKMKNNLKTAKEEISWPKSAAS
ncbi:MAG: hypothetical protein PF570_05585 [Candidatus Cloacimonetes bacterium]|jgi:hypothetical protein|nr:hypothetical protein [Candidatus Cloacimonadota bacterium]